MPRLRTVAFGAAIVAVAVSAAPAPELLALRYGLWAITTSAEQVPGGPAATEARVRMVCWTEDTARRFLELLEGGDRASCTRTIVTSTPRLLLERRECSGAQRASSSFRLEAVNDETLMGAFDASFSDNGHDMRVHRTLQGKWLDQDCGDVAPRD
jgi:hypothetical protein